MTWTMEDVREDIAIEAYGYRVEMSCPACDTVKEVLHDDRTDGPWSESELLCDECGHDGLVER